MRVLVVPIFSRTGETVRVYRMANQWDRESLIALRENL